MRRMLIAALAFAALALPPAAPAQDADGIPPAQVTYLYDRSDGGGYFLIVNNDMNSFSLDINVDSRTLYLRRGDVDAGQFVLPAGAQFAVRVRKGEYKFYWGAGRDIKIKVRNTQTTTVAFDAFGLDASGLRLVAHDGEKLKEEVLFNSVREFHRYQQRPDVIVYSTPVIESRYDRMPRPPAVTLATIGILNWIFDGNNNDKHRDRYRPVYYPPRHKGPPQYYTRPTPAPSRPVVVAPPRPPAKPMPRPVQQIGRAHV